MFKNSNTKNLGYVNGLDGLRCIAILGIVFYHILPQYVSGGFFGVLIFFLITGYLLAHKTKNELDTNRYSFSNFYQKKIWRLFPPLLFTIIVTYIAILLLLPKYNKGLLSEVLSIVFCYNNYWQLAQNTSYFAKITNASPFTHFWYLAIIAQVYFIWPIAVAIFCLIRKAKKKVHAWPVILGLTIFSAVLMAVLYDPDVDPSRIYYSLDTRAYAVLLGALIGSLDQKTFDIIGKRSNWLKSLMFAISIIITVYFFIIMDGQTPATYRWGMQLATLLFGFMLIIILTSQDSLAKIMELPPISWIGKLSYEIYLVMYPVIFIFHQVSKDAYQAKYVILELVIIVAISLIIHLLAMACELFAPKTKRYARPIIVLALLIITFIFAGIQNYLASIDKGVSDMQQLENELAENQKQLASKKKDTSSKKTDETVNQASSDEFTAIGDSVMLGAAATLQSTFPDAVIDAKESRQFVTSIDIAKDLKSSGQLKDTVIIALGTNGPFRESKGQELIDYLGKDKTIYWVGAYGASLSWQGEVNATITNLCNANDNVTYIDWPSYASSHPDWFYSDGIHLKTAGQEAYAQMIQDALNK